MVLDSIHVQNFHFMAKIVIISGVDMSSSMHIDNKKKCYLKSWQRSTQGLHDT